jgi:hypothetical protein
MPLIEALQITVPPSNEVLLIYEDKQGLFKTSKVLYVCMCMYTCVYTQLYVYVNVHIHIYVEVYTCVNIHICV